MQDIFKEQIVKRKTPPLDMVIKSAMVFGYFVVALLLQAVLAGIGLDPLVIFVYMGAIFLSWFTLGKLKVEYEYVLTNGELDIDMITNKRSRKRVLTVDLKNVELMVHHSKQTMITQQGKMVRYDSGTGGDTYVFVMKKQNAYVLVSFEPNEAMIDAIGRKMGRSKLHLK